MMKRKLVVIVLLLMVQELFATLKVTINSVQQHTPWENKVDIYCTPTGIPEGCKFVVSAIDKSSNKEYKASTLSGDLYPQSRQCHIVWDMAADGFNFKSSQVYFKVACEEKEPLYMVVDLSGGHTAKSYPVTYLSDVPSGGWTDDYKTTKLVLRRIYPGTNTLSSYSFSITKSYWMAVFETTQKQWMLVMNSNPSYYGNMYDSMYHKIPVNKVTYNKIRGADKGGGWPDNNAVDDDSFLGVLRAKTGHTFDLPTAGQWEHACRAGTTTSYSYGNNPDGAYMWYRDNTTWEQPVGTRLPNAWGLYDMHGNVCEWVLDALNPAYSYPDLSGENPVGSAKGNYKIYREYRGGCYLDFAGNCGSAIMTCYDPASC